ncbi:MAG TPA: hypothetical protein VNY53_12500, partial [Bradyrhizobium sp.]|nr:hypothetical protein [Bradyrhizobium sp.]
MRNADSTKLRRHVVHTTTTIASGLVRECIWTGWRKSDQRAAFQCLFVAFGVICLLFDHPHDLIIRRSPCGSADRRLKLPDGLHLTTAAGIEAVVTRILPKVETLIDRARAGRYLPTSYGAIRALPALDYSWCLDPAAIDF